MAIVREMSSVHAFSIERPQQRGANLNNSVASLNLILSFSCKTV